MRRLHRRLANIRTNHIHQATNAIAKTKPCKVVMVDLNVKGMMKNLDSSKAIQKQKFKEFSRQMEYKCEKYGIEFMEVDRFFPSSKKCSSCDEIKKDLKLKDRVEPTVTWVRDRQGSECGIEFAKGRAISSVITNKILLMCRNRCIPIHACGVSYQMRVAKAKADTMK